VENEPEFSTGVEDTPTISRVLALSGTGYIVVKPVTSRESPNWHKRVFFKSIGIPNGKWRLDGNTPLINPQQ
jgi:hypothetical protein